MNSAVVPRRTPGRVTALIRRSLVGVLLVASGCTGGGEAVLSPAPTPCPPHLVRADIIRLADLDTQMQGHIPTDLPAGFGLAYAWGEGDGMMAQATWTDRHCRLVTVALDAGIEQLRGAPIGEDWYVTSSGPRDCGNSVLGSGRCLRYVTVTEGNTLHVLMIGLDRPEGDRVVRSIPV